MEFVRKTGCCDPAMDHVFTTQAEAEAKVEELKGSGWEIFPSDEPERGRKGFAAFKLVQTDTGLVEEVRTVKWEMFGKELTADVSMAATAQQMVAAIRTETVEPRLCDDVLSRHLGFVWYHVDEGAAVTRRMPVRQLKEDPGAAAIIVALRERLRAME
jgi:hypothetical protein